MAPSRRSSPSATPTSCAASSSSRRTTPATHAGTFIFQHFAKLRRELSREDYIRTLIPWVYTYEDTRDGLDLEALVQRLADDPFFQAPDAYERQMRATVSFHPKDRLGRIAQPTLLIFGDDDLFTPLRFARSLHEGIRGSRLALLSGAGHGVIWTRSSEVAALIRGFVQEGKEAR